MTYQNAFTQSIKPSSLSQLKEQKDFLDFMAYFETDCKHFIESRSESKDLECRFGAITERLTKKGLLQGFLQRTAMHSRLSLLRLTPLDQHLRYYWDNYTNGEQQIRKECEIKTGRQFQFPLSQEEIEQLAEKENVIVQEAMQKSLSNYVNLIVGLSGLINSVFFAFESQCKILCSITCYSFAIKYAREAIIQHAEVWSALRKLGKVNPVSGVECDICLMQQDCRFVVSFEALANIYCYAIKVRMLADYESFFFDNIIGQKLKVYFDNLKLVIQNQKSVADKCMGVRA